MIDFGLRNLELFLKDKSAVILSFLAEFIIVVLYFLFIRDNLTASYSQMADVELIMDVWMISGVLGITSATTPMGAYGTMVDDRVKRLDRDFHTSPINRMSLLGGYLFSASVIGMIMSFIVFLMAEAYIFCRYGVTPGADSILYVYGLIIVNAISNSALVLLLVSFLKSSNALAACCTILGALIGFLTGIYLPMGSMSETVQLLIKGFPVSHGVVLFRQALAEPLVRESFGEGASAADAFLEHMGIRYTWNGAYLSESASLLILLTAAAFCMLGALLRFSVKKSAS